MPGLNSIIRCTNRIKTAQNLLESGVILYRVITENEAYIIDMNAEDQLYEQGINRLGVDIMDYRPYSPLTIQIKEEKGQPTNRVTLRDEGDFESSFYLEINRTQFEIKAADFKTEDLVKKYGRQILGLTDENISSLIWQYIYPDVLERLNRLIFRDE